MLMLPPQYGPNLFLMFNHVYAVINKYNKNYIFAKNKHNYMIEQDDLSVQYFKIVIKYKEVNVFDVL